MHAGKAYLQLEELFQSSLALWADVTLYLLIHLASYFQVLEVEMGGNELCRV